MKYYIIRIVDENKYIFSRKMLVSDIAGAKKYSSASYARQVVKTSVFAGMKYEIIEIDPCIGK
ncbi:MAG: hypothetical protein ACI4JJ_05835 [Huintestinicola sp.]